MSLLSKVKKSLKERRQRSKEQKQERKAIDREATKSAHQEYLESYRQEKIASAKLKARARGKHDASETRGTLGSIGGVAKGGFNLFSNAGKNLIESGAFDMPTSNLDLGFGTKKSSSKKGKKKKKNDLFEIGF